MKYAFEFLISVFGILATMNSSNAVEGPPQQLLGKSVVVTWSENRIQRAGGGEQIQRGECDPQHEHLYRQLRSDFQPTDQYSGIKFRAH